MRACRAGRRPMLGDGRRADNGAGPEVGRRPGAGPRRAPDLLRLPAADAVEARLPEAALGGEVALGRRLVRRHAHAGAAVRAGGARATIDVAGARRAAHGVHALLPLRALGGRAALGPRPHVGLADGVDAAIVGAAPAVGRAAGVTDAVDAGRADAAVGVVHALAARARWRLAEALRADLARAAGRARRAPTLAGPVATARVGAALVVELAEGGMRRRAAVAAARAPARRARPARGRAAVRASRRARAARHRRLAAPVALPAPDALPAPVDPPALPAPVTLPAPWIHPRCPRPMRCPRRWIRPRCLRRSRCPRPSRRPRVTVGVTRVGRPGAGSSPRCRCWCGRGRPWPAGTSCRRAATSCHRCPNAHRRRRRRRRSV